MKGRCDIWLLGAKWAGGCFHFGRGSATWLTGWNARKPFALNRPSTNPTDPQCPGPSAPALVDRPRPTLRPAEVGWLSQYPGDEEWLWPPGTLMLMLPPAMRRPPPARGPHVYEVVAFYFRTIGGLPFVADDDEIRRTEDFKRLRSEIVSGICVADSLAVSLVLNLHEPGETPLADQHFRDAFYLFDADGDGYVDLTTDITHKLRQMVDALECSVDETALANAVTSTVHKCDQERVSEEVFTAVFQDPFVRMQWRCVTN